MDEKLKQIQKLLDAAEGNLHSARNLMRELLSSDGAPLINPEEKAKDLNVIEEGRIVEGVYNGENMVGPDGKEYPVPANYASKSKLVEGDVLKLTIADDGSFIFKQIRPIDRRKTVGTLSYAGGNYSVNADGKTYKVLQASVTYYRGEPGDQVTLILPKDHESTWAAIENIVKKIDEPTDQSSEANQSEVSESVSLDNSTPQEVAEQVAEEKSESGPEIEFPASTSEANLAAEDQEILQNLSEKTVPNEPTETPTPEAAPAEPEEPKVDESKGISELDI